jgi:hypothetical protein
VSREIPPESGYKDFVNMYNEHIRALDQYLKEELARLWANFTGWEG